MFNRPYESDNNSESDNNIMKRTTKITTTPGMFLLMLGILLISRFTWAEATASVDRNKVGLNETFELTISIDSSSFFGGPDLDPLKKDFSIMGRSQNSRITSVNGSMEAVTEWAITLAPKKVGKFTIPPIKVSRESTQPIEVEVTQDTPQRGISGGNNRIFLEAEFDQQEAFVQAQLIYTVRIVSPIELLDKAFQAPAINNALVEPLGESAYSKMINGQRYAIYEARFALFPQASGELTVPALRAEALVPVRRQHNMFNLGTSGRKIQLSSPEATLTIKEKPTKYPDNVTWLPAKSLTVSEQWSDNTKQLEVGQSITRRIVITAEGLSGEQLPPTAPLQIDGIKAYPDKADVSSKAQSQGVIGTRVESTALQATRSGTFTIPEIKIQWWDTSAKRIRVAKLPARTLRVKGAISQPGSSAIADTQAVIPTQTPSAQIPNTPDSQEVITAVPLLWKLLCGFLALGWVITLLLYWHAKRAKSSAKAPATTNTPALQPSLEAAYKELETACRKNAPGATRDALIQWAKLLWPNKSIHCLADLQTVSDDPKLKQRLIELDKAVYSPAGKSWQGAALLAQLQTLKQLQSTRADAGKALPPLYN